jgi:hypothetical protein
VFVGPWAYAKSTTSSLCLSKHPSRRDETPNRGRDEDYNRPPATRPSAPPRLYEPVEPSVTVKAASEHQRQRYQKSHQASASATVITSLP